MNLPNQAHDDSQRRGYIIAILTYTVWGLFPFYFNLLHDISVIEILLHRIVWSALFTFGIVLFISKHKLVWQIISSWKELLPYLFSSFFLAINWGLYIYGIALNDVLQLSLAYFINPLFNVLFGVLFFKERLGPLTKIAIGLALIGVLYRAFGIGGVPILAITIAIAFSLYGVLRKQTKADSITSLFIESVLVMPFIVVAFCLYTPKASLSLMLDSAYWFFILLLAGPITSIPLIMFSMAVKRIPYYMIGFFQYIAPTILFICAVFVFNEHYTTADLITFGLVWLGILLVVFEQLLRLKRKQILG